MSRGEAQNLFHAAAWRKTVKVTCRCGHSVVFEPAGLWWLCERKGWPQSFIELRRRLYCASCIEQRKRVVRPARIDAVQDAATVTLPPPPDREWKRALDRYRS
jgi:uncharacterized membrane protein